MKRLASLSQKYLRSPRLVAELISSTNISKDDTVYDIGAGSGIITSLLAPRCRQVIAIEVDPRIATTLQRNTQHYTNVSVYEADFLKMPLPKGSYKVFANIPFGLSSAIVRKLTQTARAPNAAYLIVQKEFAYKLLPDSTGYTSLLAVLLGVEFDISIKRHLNQSDFVPSPKVRPVLLSIVKRPQPLVTLSELAGFKAFVTNAYGRTRTLKKAVKHQISHQQFSKFAQSENLAVSVRPSQLQLRQWVALYQLARKA